MLTFTDDGFMRTPYHVGSVEGLPERVSDTERVESLARIVRTRLVGYRRMFGDAVHYHFDEVPNVNPAGLTAWFVAAGTGLTMTLTGVGAAFAPVVTVLLSAAIYGAMLRVARPTWYATGPAAAAARAAGRAPTP